MRYNREVPRLHGLRMVQSPDTNLSQEQIAFIALYFKAATDGVMPPPIPHCARNQEVIRRIQTNTIRNPRYFQKS